MKKSILYFGLILSLGFLSSCDDATIKDESNEETVEGNYQTVEGSDLNVFSNVELTADISHLSANEKEVLKLMFKAASLMEDIYWQEAYGDRDELLNGISDEQLKLFTKINYGPWDRLDDNKPFIQGFGEKPAGANFYPADMTKEEFDALEDKNKESLYTLIRRNEEGNLKVVWYHEAFSTEVEQAVALLEQASELAEDDGLKKYLSLRAEALLTDDYRASDMAWMDMKSSNIDFVVGPIENYEDHLFGYKAAHEAFILIKDVEWSNRLARFAKFLPQMQMDLPVDEKYKKDVPGSDVDLNAYDVVFYAGDCNAGSKTIAINLPNDEVVQKKKGSRKLQLKNAMKAKFDKILVPIADVLITESQRKHIKFDAFFANTMFHEVSHAMGVKRVITDTSITCRVALKEQYSALEEGKADILGLYLVTKLYEMGELPGTDLHDNYVTFMASIFRSIRFGAASAHGKANMIRFNYFLENGAFTRNEDGTYTVNFEKMQEASKAITIDIIGLQGDGDYEAAKAYVEKWSGIRPQLKEDLQRLTDANIPKDIYYTQGPEVLGL
ncbi:MAG: Zn-dependent hydrolase [Bacteroidetes bacterium]|nr:MAG: Zn-dependent hydrolase [Bacteroidota bacterium]